MRLALFLLLKSLPISAEVLPENAIQQLQMGETLLFPETIEEDEQRYVGGVAYTLVDISLEQMTPLLERAETYQAILPRIKSAKWTTANPHEPLLHLRHSTSLMDIEYTLIFQKDIPHRTTRFWMDKRSPHPIEDAWGFIRFDPIITSSHAPQALITYGVLVNIGPGLIRTLFEEKIRDILLYIPHALRRYLIQSASPPSPSSPHNTLLHPPLSSVAQFS
ncbi:hypothetical protein [Pajaroellobacter abortibovis]|nr:hypothetical protein [Pajaroellobacter abortibovis]